MYLYLYCIGIDSEIWGKCSEVEKWMRQTQSHEEANRRLSVLPKVIFEIPSDGGFGKVIEFSTSDIL